MTGRGHAEVDQVEVRSENGGQVIQLPLTIVSHGTEHTELRVVGEAEEHDEGKVVGSLGAAPTTSTNSPAAIFTREDVVAVHFSHDVVLGSRLEGSRSGH